MPRGARLHIREADKVLYLVADRITILWLQRLNPTAESLHGFYAENKPRRETYREMAEHIVSFLHKGLNVCVVCYGHPGIFVDPMHAAIRAARAQQFDARMYPGISAIDWLFADLGVDPAARGCQIHDAGEVLADRRQLDPASSLILLQVGAIGQPNLPIAPNLRGFRLLLEYLSRVYGPNHEITLYAASPYSIAKPSIQNAPLRIAHRLKLSFASTLYVPAKPRRRKRMNRELLAKLTAQ